MIANPSIWGALSDAASSAVYLLVNAGAPVDGTTGANLAGTGCLLVDTTNKLLYINNGTFASPTWLNIGGPGGGSVTLNGIQTLTNKTLTAPAITSPTITGTTSIGNGCTLTTPVIGVATGTSVALSGDCKAATFHVGSTAGADGGPFTAVTGITVVKGIVTAITGT